MERAFDAIVIGAGPGGTAFARVAAQSGLSVLVLDKRKEIGSPVRCGEGIGKHWHGKLKLPLRGGAVAAKIVGAKLFAPNGKSVVVKNPQSKGFVLERKIFDKYMAIEAARAGARILPKTIATELIRENGKIAGVKARTFDDEVVEFRAPLLVSAEGMEAKIARQAGFADAVAGLYDTDSCFEYELANVECEPLIEIWFSNIYAKRGYVWVFPKSRHVANVGIGVGGATGLNPKERLDKFIAAHPERFKNAEIVEVKAGNIWVGPPLKEFVQNNFMVIGTAAHQVDPIHGGGMALAIEAGTIAAEVAAKAARTKDFSKRTLAEYEKRWRATEEAKLLKRLKLRRVLEMFSDEDFNKVFEAIDSKDFERILEGSFAPVVKKVLLKRPSLLKVLRTLA
ncbi:MAG: NAD(P)/FAD-dependent oxidoreductase [Candidatus Norongarragalinales archaeon]